MQKAQKDNNLDREISSVIRNCNLIKTNIGRNKILMQLLSKKINPIII